MSASLDQSRSQQLHAAAELADRAGGESTERFLRRYYRHVATEDLLARAPVDLLGAALSHQQLAANRPVGTANVRVFTPTVEETAGPAAHTVVEIVTDDMPFLVDSVTAELSRQERGIHLVVHPQLVVRRDATGALWQVDPATSTGQRARSPSAQRGRVVDARRDRPRELDRGPHEADRGRACAACSRTSATVGRGLAEDAQRVRPGSPPSSTARRRPASTPRRSREARALLQLARRRPLHLPRLPRVHRCARDRRATSCCAGDRAPGSASCATTSRARPRFGRLTAAGAGQGARAEQLLMLTKANSRSTVHRLDLPRLHRRQEVRRGRRGHRRAPLPRPVRLHRLHRDGPADPGASPRRSHAVLERVRLHARQPLRQGPARGPRDLPARRAVPDRASTQLYDDRDCGACTCRSGAGPGCSCARTTTAGSCPASSTSRATATPPRSGCGWRRSCADAFGGARSTTPRG